MIRSPQKIERQRIKEIPGSVGDKQKIKRQRIKEIGTSSIKPKKLPPIKI